MIKGLKAGVFVDDKPEWAVVTQDGKCSSATLKFSGFGVMTWHNDKEDADHNAKLTGGTVVPVDYFNGEMIMPPLAIYAGKGGFDKWLNDIF